jgi:GNAT superfamily N-acetyltransferase
MSDIVIRAMQPFDAAAVNRLSEQLGYPHPLSETEQRINHMLPDDNNHLLVALAAAGVIGWMHVRKTFLLESGAFAEIAALVIDEQHRGKRAGERLVAAAKAWCVAEKISRLRVRSNVVRARAHRFYLRIGFRELKESKVFETDL